MARKVEEWIASSDDQRAPPRVRDLVGKTYGMLRVTAFSHIGGKQPVPFWKCVCTCGRERTARGAELNRGDIQSCGCAAKTGKKDISALVFSKWKVLHADNARASVRTYWICQCECGEVRSVATIHLMNGKSTSCGCNRPTGEASKAYKHGSNPDVYGVWCNMIQRCENKNNPHFHNYGGRGISICQSWRSDFSVFEMDMGPRPTPTHTLDRVDNNGDYHAGNCRWATRTQQARNSRRNLLVEMDGKSVPLIEACEMAGVNYDAAKWRHHAGYDWSGLS